jgi:hypothetical protein
MNPDKAVSSKSDHCGDADATLRLIAGLPAPEGLEDRVHEALRKAPRTGRVLEWPVRLTSDSQWMRSAAAAAIAFVVVGGGWGVYSRVQTARVIPMPPHAAAPGGFSSGGTMRIPQTVHGPEIKPQEIKPQEIKPQENAKPTSVAAPNGAHVVAMPAQQSQANATKKNDPGSPEK